MTPASLVRSPLLLAAIALASLVGCGVDGPGGDDPVGNTSEASSSSGSTSAASTGSGSGPSGSTGSSTGSSSSSSGAGGSGGGGTGVGGGEDCPDGVICAASLPFIDNNTTIGAPAELDGYGCDPGVNESGPERVYRIDLDQAGLLVTSLDNLGAGVDVDVHILEQLAPGDCIDRGHWDAAAYLQPGQYWVVVDSWVDGQGDVYAGDYQLTVAATHATSHVVDGLDSMVLDMALRAFDVAWFDGETIELEYGIIDYNMPSIEPRFFVLDLRHGSLLYAEYASHGEGSQHPNDLTLTGSMSNQSGSHASSVGMVRTAETYYGSNGFSLRLDGLEPGFNDNDRDRAIVIHGADYATQSFIDMYGYLGRSWGCPAVRTEVTEEFIDTIAEGRLVLKVFDDLDWHASSSFLNP